MILWSIRTFWYKGSAENKEKLQVRKMTMLPTVGPWGGGIDWGGDTSEDYTKPHKTIQSPDRLYKAPTDYTKP